MKLWIRPGRDVTVSLTDGSAINGKTRFALPGKLKLSGVVVGPAEVAGVVIIPHDKVLTVQVMP
jgi:hypothetical protein